MKKLIGMLKGLPPEMQTLLAVAGVSGLGSIFFLAPKLGISSSTFAFIILGVVVLLSVLSLVVRKIFGLRSSQRKSKMEQELGRAGEGGPSSMDVRAVIKSNNEKFFAAIREMRKLGVNVYDLPWFIIIGDSGCGKTKLVERGGATFAQGKPEGYQLGTLNYNWWFAEEAVFVDMAGRLCNPQDDADRREWIAFLDTVAKGRKGFPINGAIVCISAEHLLEDSPEKHEADANTLLERLRDLQTKLGVTFATHVVVTQCDRVLGFMPFFDRAQVDITIKNQIFGWSRPGEFTELYDPEEFGHDFDQLYARLNDLRLRRLADDADEVELGLAYSFPEEFRAFREPLAIYVRTLFPMIKNPRAIKNLVLRGVYFTSALQEGNLLTKHLSERLGAEAASQFAPLQSLYPKSRPHFVKDLLFKKVFPEFGLVFRNEQQVVRHRRLAKVLLYSSFAAFVGLMGVLGVSCYQFEKIMTAPQLHVEETQKLTPTQADALQSKFITLGADKAALKSPWAWILSLGLGSDKPREALETIRRELFRRHVVAQAIGDVESVLQKPVTDANNAAFEKALEAYIQWMAIAGSDGSANPESSPAGKDFDSNPLWQLVAAPTTAPADTASKETAGSIINTKDFKALWDDYKDASLPRLASAQAVQGNEPAAAAVVRKAVDQLYDYYKGYAILDEKNRDPVINEWMRIKAQCNTVAGTYGKILGDDNPITTSDQYQNYVKTLNTQVTDLSGALQASAWNKGKSPRYEPLATAVAAQKKRWDDLYVRLTKAATGGRKEFTDALTLLDERDDAARPGIDVVHRMSVKTHNATPPGGGDEAAVREVSTQYAYIITAIAPDQPNAGVTLTPDASAVQGALQGILKTVNEATTQPAERSLAEWNQYLEALNKQAKPATDALAKLTAAWRPAEFKQWIEETAVLVQRGRLGMALQAIAKQLDAAKANGWGLAAASGSDYADCVGIRYFRMEECAGRERSEKRTAAPDAGAAPTEGRRSRLGTPKTAAPTAAPVADSRSRVVRCATREFLDRAIDQAGALDYFLGSSFPYVGDPQLVQQVKDALEASRQTYLDQYFKQWRTAYGAIALPTLNGALKATTWAKYREEIGTASAPVGDDLAKICGDLLEHVYLIGWNWPSDWSADRARLEKAQQNAGWPKLPLQQYAAMPREDNPWDVIAQRVTAGWTRFSRDVGSYKNFVAINQMADARANAINWNPLDTNDLRDLFFKTQPLDTLLAASVHGQELLNAEIQQIIRDRQTPLQASGDLPYTTDADKFWAFLKDMTIARKYFQSVDVDLPQSTQRVEFYRNCENWENLLGAGKAWAPLPLTVSINRDFQGAQTGYPFNLVLANVPKGLNLPPTYGPQNSYSELRPSLALAEKETNAKLVFFMDPDPSKGKSTIACEYNWPGSEKLRMELGGEGLQKKWPAIGKDLPQTGKLCLMEFLQKYGKSTDGLNWSVGVAWNLCELLREVGSAEGKSATNECDVLEKQGGQTFPGIKLEFKLDRPLPPPFAPLPAPKPVQDATPGTPPGPQVGAQK